MTSLRIWKAALRLWQKDNSISGLEDWKMRLWLERLGGRLLAAAIVAVSYKWRHNTLLSISPGTADYMLLLRFL